MRIYGDIHKKKSNFLHKKMLNLLPFALSIFDRCVKIASTVSLSGKSEIFIIYE